ncbi:LOW QUALITY PROTEIN: hypothetical protein QTO34_014340 [Cnephaeus nilssonii]|uniref:Reverse transcriptase domain-containing protein n=1 Tax=Cnephaeus nilssonii TaxID=3371016 RepID=A0AA40LTZ1_CNENI|nr:LOW QUALITY PROTEIN: hypothetical protein QTO34_014340 [Eptesicus nilssonii]
MGAEITFAPDGSTQLHLGDLSNVPVLSSAQGGRMETLYLPKDSPLEPELEEEFLMVWAEGNPPGLAKDHAPVLIDLKPGAQPIKICKYPIPRDARLGIQVHLDRLLHWHPPVSSCLPLSGKIQNYGAKEQFTWTRLPQGFKNSPTLFSRALVSDLSKFPGEDLGCILLQYVDNLLLASSTRAQCWERTQALLRLLIEKGYQVSKKKAQICQKSST